MALIALIFTWGNNSYASEPVLFGYAPNSIENLSLEKYLGTDHSEKYEFARHDLNSDGLSEFIAKEIDCSSNSSSPQFCHYKILASDIDVMTELAQFDAKGLKLSNNFFKGIRDLHIYNIDKNDYDYTTLRWNPTEMSFIPIENGM